MVGVNVELGQPFVGHEVGGASVDAVEVGVPPEVVAGEFVGEEFSEGGAVVVDLRAALLDRAVDAERASSRAP